MNATRTYAGDEFYVVIALNAAVASLTFYCTTYEYKYSRNRWYLATNAIACMLNCVGVARVISQRYDIVNALGIYAFDLVLFDVLMLLLIEQNVSVLEFFSFLSKRFCSKVIKYSKWFLVVQSLLQFIFGLGTMCTWYLYTSQGNRAAVWVLFARAFTYNSLVVGTFLITQTTLQNFWIVKKVYVIVKPIHGIDAKVIYPLALILGSCVILDW